MDTFERHEYVLLFRKQLSLQLYEQVIVYGSVITIYSIVIRTTGVFSVMTLAAPVLTYIKDKILGLIN